MRILPLEYYQQEDTLFLSKDLLGKVLFTHWEGRDLCAGIIVETEAYQGPEDKASHAYNNRCTERTQVMFEAGGVCYVYFCYGMHHLFNIVTHKEGIPHAILLRAIEPLTGIDIMLERCHKKEKHLLTSGPARLTQAMGIKTHHTGLLLDSPHIWVEDHGLKIPSNQILSTPRVGVDYAQEDAELPWRFRIKDNPWTSPAK